MRKLIWTGAILAALLGARAATACEADSPQPLKPKVG